MESALGRNKVKIWLLQIKVLYICSIRLKAGGYKNYHLGMKVTEQPMKYGNIHLWKGCYIGINAMILPGVHIDEGAVIGSCALVTKDIPAWTIATGVPAKVVKNVEKPEIEK